MVVSQFSYIIGRLCLCCPCNRSPTYSSAMVVLSLPQVSYTQVGYSSVVPVTDFVHTGRL